MTKLIVDEYLNAGGKLVVALRRSLLESPRYFLSRQEATELRDELTRALGLADEDHAIYATLADEQRRDQMAADRMFGGPAPRDSNGRILEDE